MCRVIPTHLGEDRAARRAARAAQVVVERVLRIRARAEVALWR